MVDGKPITGGVVWTLRAFSILELLAALLSLTAFNFDNATVFQIIFTSVILSPVLWAVAAIVQALRRIEFNTRKTA